MPDGACTAHAEKAETISHDASPGKLDEQKWVTWHTAFQNFLSVLPGSNGVPLSYVVRENEEPATQEEIDEEGMDFTSECIACAPLEGPHFDADKRQVHQLVVGFTQGQSARAWIKKQKNKGDGRLDMKLLCAHYDGAVNTSRRLAKAECLRETFHHRSERIFTFKSFLQGMHKMSNIFAKEDQDWMEDAKIRFCSRRFSIPDCRPSCVP